MTEKPKENPHLPRYIKLKPWYYGKNGDAKGTNDDKDYLEHHRQSKAGQNIIDIENNNQAKLGTGISDDYITYGQEAKEVGTGKVRLDGIKCSNCGMIGHKKRDCLERPKKQHNNGYTNDRSKKEIPNVPEGHENKEIKIRDDTKMNYDAKQDRWFGYTGEEYEETISKWVQEKAKSEKDQDKEDIIQEYDMDEKIELYKLGLLEEYQISMAKLNDEIQRERQIGKSSVRLREDKALYLNDINSDELKYDPKSRLYKSEEMGTVNEKTKMFHRHIVGEGLEMVELNKTLREEAKRKGIRDEISNREKVNHVLIANPTKYDPKLNKSKQNIVPNPTAIQEQAAQSLQGTEQSEQKKRTLADMYD